MLSNKETKQLKTYQEYLSWPKWQFLLFYGVLGWGITTAILVSLVTVLTSDISFRQMLGKDLWINLISFPVGGFFFGLLMRGFMKRQFNRLQQKDSYDGAE